jgi:hypothetical protein
MGNKEFFMKTKTSVQSVRLFGIAGLLAAIVISMTALSLTGCDLDNVDNESVQPDKTVTVGTQTGTLTAGVAGSVAYAVTTANIANGSYTAVVANLPAGVTVSGQVSIAGNTGTLTLAGNTSTTAATTSNLTLTLDGATSAAFSLAINAGGGNTKTVSVGEQAGTLTAGTAGTVTYAVTTANIADGSYAAAVENLPAGVTVSGQVTIAEDSGTLTLAGDTSTTAGVTGTLTLTLDGATSSVFSLTINEEDGDTPIMSVSVELDSPPETDTVRKDTATVPHDANYSVGAVIWTGDLENGKFKASTKYTATVTLTADEGYTFTGGAATAHISNEEADVSNNSGTTLTLSAEFTTVAGTFVSITIKTQPLAATTQTVTHGTTLDADFEVTVTYNSGSENCKLADFSNHSISMHIDDEPIYSDTELDHINHHGKKIVLQYGNHTDKTVETDELYIIPPFSYVITGSGTTFTATRGFFPVGTANQPIQTVIDAIKTDAAANACEIQFGDGDNTLDIGTASASFNTANAWGLVTLKGKITSANNTSTAGTIIAANNVSIKSEADIANTAASSNGRAVYFNSTGTLTIDGGTVSGTAGVAIYNSGGGTINISGGTVSATTGYAVYCYNNSSRLNISQESGKTTLITSANSSSIQGTIHFDYGVTFQMTGGTVQNTSTGTNGNAINAANYSGMKMTISGGSVSTTATSGYAVRCVNPSTELILDESPAITGMIQIGIGKFSLGASFSTTDTYNIVPITYVPGIAIENGANFLSNFTFLSFPSFLNKEVSGNDIVFVVTFNYTKTGTTYTITRDGAGDGAGYPDAQLTVDAIKADANGAACIIQFGNGTDVLDIFDTNINFNNTTGTWGAITLKGKIQSTNTAATGIIAINNDISITSDADIKATVGLSTQRAINFNSTGTLTINSGAVSLPSSGYMVYNAYTGTVNITGGTITNNSLSGYAVYNSSSGIVNISGGAIVGANGYAVYNNSNGTVNISGGTVSTTSGYAVRNFSAGTVNITGGTISATIGYAVYSTAAGKINISQDAGKNTLITSANISATQGTIAITGANGELTITGGRVENTSVNAAVRNVIYISNATVKANITGGTIATASTSGDFAVNNTQAGNAANIKVDPACIAAGNNCNNVTAP